MRSKMPPLMMLGLLVAAQSALADRLGLGDPAPAISVTKWIKGDPVDLSAQKGKGVVVVEFWATWCGPCVTSIPDLTELQQTYKNKGVTIIGFARHDEDNTQEIVEKFVSEQGRKMGYTIAYEKDSTTFDAYMKAAGQDGIPTSFVIDRAGRIAWIGHPMDGLDDVVLEIVAGKYDIEVAKKIAAIQERIYGPESADDPQETLKALNEWIALKPQDPSPYQMKFRVYAYELKKPVEARAAASKAIEAAATKPEKLARIAEQLAYEEHEHAYDELAARAMGRAFKQAPGNPEVIIARFTVLAATGKETEAIAWAQQAVETLKSDPDSVRRFAMALAAPERTSRCNALAVLAVDLAIAAEPDNASHLRAKFHIQAVCQKNPRAAEATGRYLIEKAGDDAGMLNMFAWDLLTEDDTKGKFNELALAAAQRCDKVSESKNWMYVDTFALAKFENGAVAEAIKLQEKAIELCDSPQYLPELKESLKQFEDGKG